MKNSKPEGSETSSTEVKKTAEQKHIEELFQKKAHCDTNSTTLAQTLEKDIQSGFKGGHKYLFELLQNADDAALPDVPQTVTIHLYKDSLIITHKGRHFSYTDVEKITDNAQQRFFDKAKDSEKTGYKGIGFKSVFSISDCVCIVSENYCFRFDKQYEQWKTAPKDAKYPWPLIPIWTEKSNFKNVNNDEVHFIIRINSADAIREDLNYLIQNPMILLFLRHTKQLMLKDNDQITRFLLKQKSKSHFNLYCNKEIHSRWLTYDKTLTISETAKEKLQKLDDYQCPARMKEATHTRISFAVQLDEKSQIIPPKSSQLFCYLPTTIPVPFPFYVNADFLLRPDRASLQENYWNQYLFFHIAKYQFFWMIKLNASETFRYQILKLMTPKALSRFSEYCANFFHQGFQSGLKKTFIPSQTNPNLLLTIEEALLDITGFYQHFKDLGFKNLIHDHLQETKKLHHVYPNLKIISIKTLAKKLPDYVTKNPSTAFQKQLLQFLEKKMENSVEWRNNLTSCSFILTKNNKTASPDSLKYPEENEEKALDIIHHYVDIIYPNPELLEPEYLNILKELGATSSSAIAVFRKNILEHFDIITPDNVLPITTFILYLYEKLEEDDVKKLKSFPVLTQHDTLIPADSSYFSDKYDPKTKLEFKFKEADIFLSDKYLPLSSNQKSLKDFFKKIGVQFTLRFFNRQKYDVQKALKAKGETFKAYLSIHPIPRAVKYSTNPTGYLCEFLDFTFIAHIRHSFILSKFWVSFKKQWEMIRNTPGAYYLPGGQRLTTNYIQYVVRNTPSVPSQDGTPYPAKDIYGPKEEFESLKQYLPIENIGLTQEQCQYLNLKQALSLDDCLDILKKLQKSLTVNIDAYTIILNCILKIRDRNPISYEIYLPSQNREIKPASSLYFLDIPEKQDARYSGDWIFPFKDFDHNARLELANYFKLQIIQQKDLSFSCEEATIDHATKKLIYSMLPRIARFESADHPTQEEAQLIRLILIHEHLIYSSAKKITFSMGNIRIPEKSHFENHHLFYRGEWNGISCREFCRSLGEILEINTKTKNCLEDILKSSDEEFIEILIESGISTNPLSNPEMLTDKIEIHKQETLLTSEEEREIEALEETKEPDDCYFDEKNEFPNIPYPTSIQPKPTLKLKTIKLDPPKASAKLPAISADPEYQISPKNPTPSKTSSFFEEASVDNQQVGVEGEKFVYQMLKKHYQEKYPYCKFSETAEGFHLKGTHNKNPLDLHVIWHNKQTESGDSKDFSIIKNGQERIVEVKSSKVKKSSFFVSDNEYALAKQYGHRFRFFHVQNVANPDAIALTKIKDPIAQIETGQLCIKKMELKPNS